MTITRLIFFLYSALAIIVLPAQEPFFSSQNYIFQKSQTQWLCTELQKINPTQFSCDNQAHHWVFPNQDSCEIFGVYMSIPQEEKDQFKELLFPKGDCKRYLSMLSLCDLYFPLFKKECTNVSISTDFRFLPLLLSGCNQSFEDANGKAGLWALDYLVARKSHLRVDTLIDERRGGDFTTKAAIAHLHELLKKYNNAPLLATVAYIKNVPYTNQFAHQTNDKEILSAVDEDTRYFLHFLAYVKSLISSTRTNNQLNNYFDIMAHFEPLALRQPTHMEALRSILQLDEQQMKQFNPVYSGAVIEPNYRKVPFMIDRSAALKFEKLSDSIYAWTPEVKQTVETEIREELFYYKVRRGDSLGKIAEKHYVSIKEIKKWNNLKGDKISKGQKLKLYREVKRAKEKIEPEEKVQLEESKKQESAKTNEAETSEVIVDHTSHINDLKSEAETLEKNEKYTSAIKKYEEIILLDSGNTNAQDRIAELKKKIAAKKVAEQKKSDNDKVMYTVKPGDSLWKIAKKYPGVSDQDIMKWNKCGEDIRPGQKLVIFPNRK
jgi:membrane-bound lytic murein transglycosylase D